MKRSAAPKLFAYLALVVLVLIAAFLTRRPEMVVVATPFAFMLVLALPGTGGVTDVKLTAQWPRERLIEGECLRVRLTIQADRDVELMDIKVTLPNGLTPSVGHFTVTELPATEQRIVELPVRCDHWGVYSRLQCELAVSLARGFFREEGRAEMRYALRVYPNSETLRAMVRPRETQPSAGNLVARGVGSGIEFAEIRPFQPGDELRHVNWRATARHGEKWVNARRPERNADVILFLDTFVDIGSAQSGTLDLTVRAAAALAARYLRDRERVGVIGFGGTVEWLIPGSGQRQLYQIVESLLTTRLSFSYAWKDVSFIPRHTLPPQALVVALTPLVDERTIQALFDLLRRGFDTAILELSPAAFLPAASSETLLLARRIWSLDRALLLDRYREFGGAVVSWSSDRSLESAIEEVSRYRRHARVVSAS